MTTAEEEANKRQKTSDMKRVLIFGGKTGWIGQMMAELVKKEGANGLGAYRLSTRDVPSMSPL